MTLKSFDTTKPVQLRDGKPARIVSTKLSGQFPIAAVIARSDGSEALVRYSADGKYNWDAGDHPFDLINIPEKRTLYLNIYADGGRDVCANELSREAVSERIACVEVTYEEGEGVTTDPIAAARAMIEPLTGHTPKPWWTSGQYSGREMGCSIIAANPSAGPAPGNPTRGQVAFATAILNTDARRCEANARLIAAAPDLRDMVPTLADALEVERAKVAAAYEAGQLRMRELCADMVEREGHGLHVAIRYAPLIPADAQAALDKLLAEARLAGWRAGREAAAEHCYAKRDLLADAERKQIEDGLTGRDYYGRRLEAELLSRSIRALPEPKEASHD